MKGGISFHAEVISPATLFHLPVVLNAADVDPIEPPPSNLDGPGVGWPNRITIDYAHADPSDPSAFEFNFHSGSFVGTIRGKLKDDDTIELTDLSKEGKWANIRPVFWPLENQ